MALRQLFIQGTYLRLSPIRFLKALRVFRRLTMAAVLLCFLLMYHLNPTLAASGGSVGGDSWSDSDSDSDSDSHLYSSDSDSWSHPSSSPSKTNSPEERKGQAVFCLLIMGAIVVLAFTCSSRSTATVVKLQVGLLSTARTLLKDLDQIAETADTSTRKDLSRVLTEATAALLRHPHHCISGYSSVAPKETVKDAQKCFNQVSLEERAKFEEETLVNVNNIKRKSTTKRPKGLHNQYIVVTILVGVKGMHKFPGINDNSDLNEALQNLRSIPSRDLLAVRVLWTPQQENDTLSEQELLKDYPLLKQF
ncbi:uncharacterized protein LOC112191635 isoform X1 [Rosa chinensis]|uniref:uncharacterized protein LOC112191635 isoform X1 n=1 Tax=Rosa chinensis TaxID=74649 RepID=UPI000D0911A2|nr:uncharacterized protein LOC112191635 isoform X1 [Rosa chinensis]